MNTENNKIKIGFWGTSEYSVMTLQALYDAGFNISFIVTMPDKPKGRKLILTPPEVKVWGEKHNIPVFQPEKLKNNTDFISKIKSFDCDVFVVIAYGKIIPDEILNIPKAKSINIHASLLPRLRGSCPIETAILNDEKVTGVTIMQMDNEMDHGPIIAQEEVIVEPWPPIANVLGRKIVETGNKILINILPKWINNEIKPIVQDHSKATYTTKIKKEDGEINLNNNPYKNFLKIQAYNEWPSAFFFVNKNDKKIRIKITKASFNDGKLNIEKVIPEGKKEMNFKDLVF